jgi:hypothetical protein
MCQIYYHAGTYSETSELRGSFGMTRDDASWATPEAKGSRVRSMRGEAGQLAGSDGGMAELLRPDGYIVPVCPAFPFVLTVAGSSAGYWRPDQA